MRRCLYVIPYTKLNLQVGFMKTTEIEAGKELSTVVEVDTEKSIVSIMLQTDAYDIQFGIFRATEESCYVVENEDTENELITHPNGNLEEVYPLKVIDSAEQVVKVTFIAKETGFYKILFSNAHSWMRAKTLHYRTVLLKPVDVLNLADLEAEEDLLTMSGQVMDSVPQEVYNCLTVHRKSKGDLEPLRNVYIT